MEVWAAIDLYQGRIITPVRGKPDQTTVSNEEPLAVAERWEREGASGLHIVDLDAAFESGSNRLISETIIHHVRIPVQLGGGLRTTEDVQRWLQRGVSRVILGTLAYQDPSTLDRLVRAYGPKRIIVATDYRDGMVVTKGWTRKENVTVMEAIKRLEAMRIETVLATAVDLDGTGQGPDIATLRSIRDSTNMRILASGGLRTQEDLLDLQHIGVDGAVVGRALYEGTIRLAELNLREA